MRRKLVITLCALAALVPLAPAAQAVERVTLRNGFDVQCNHHSQVKSRIRLFLNTGEDSYIEFAPQEIVQFEQVPDPPPMVVERIEKPQAGPVEAAATDVKLSPADLREMLAKAGHEHNLDVDLLASLVKAESGGNARAVSRAGARGLMQLMPRTASDLGVDDSFKPEQNVRGGSVYLDWLLTRYHDNMSLALAAYNAGPAAVDKYHGIPPYHETKVYVARVIHEFNRRVQARDAEARHAVASSVTPQEKTSR